MAGLKKRDSGQSPGERKEIKLPTKFSTDKGFLELDVVLKKWDSKTATRETVGAVIKYLKDASDVIKFFKWVRVRRFRHDTFTYNCLLDKLTRLRKFGEAREFYEEMLVSTGVLPNGFTYAVLIQSSCSEKKSDEVLTMLTEMVDKGYKPSTTLYRSVVDCLALSGEDGERYEVLGRVTDKKTAAETLMRKAFIIHYVVSEKLVEATKLFQTMFRKGYKPDPTIYSFMIMGLCKTENVREAYKMFLDMTVGNDSYVPSVSAWTSLLVSLCKSGRISDAFNFCRMMVKSNQPGGGSVYDMLIRLLVETGNMEQAEEAFREALQENLRPSQSTCNTVIQELCRGKRGDKAVELLQLMIVKSGYSPDMTTHSAVIDTLCTSDKGEDAEDFLARNIHIRPSSVIFSYNSLLNSLCKAGRVHRALEVFSRMSARNVAPDMVSYTILIDGLCKSGEVNRAEKLFNQMIHLSVTPGLPTYNALLNGLMKKGRVQDAKSLFQEMVCSPDVITYSTLIHGLCLAKKYGEARELFDKMISRGCLPNAVTYNCLLHGLCKEGKIQEAKIFFENMLKQGCVPDKVTYTTLVYGLCNSEMIQDGIKMFNEMVTKGHDPDVVAYNCLLKGFFVSGKPGEAKQMFKVMGKKCKPDTVTHNIMIDGLSKAGMIDDAYDVFESMAKLHKCVPSLVTYNSMISGLCSHQRVNEALKVFKGMNCPPDEYTFNLLLEGLYSAGGGKGEEGRLFLQQELNTRRKEVKKS